MKLPAIGTESLAQSSLAPVGSPWMIDILFEDESILVIDKPAGLASQPGEGVVGSVVSVLEKQLGCRVFPIHRLDKDTAGCMMLAKNSAAASRWSAVLSERRTHKRYLAICIGEPPKDQGIYRDALKMKDRLLDAETSFKRIASFGLRSGRGEGGVGGVGGVVGVGGGGDSAETERRREEGPHQNKAPAFSLVEFRLGSGRTHQIRRHCALHGHPIVGDDRYGNFALNRRLKKEAQAKRLFLWAWGLELPGIGIIISAPPGHFIDFLGRWPGAPSLESLLGSLSANSSPAAQANTARRRADPSQSYREEP